MDIQLYYEEYGSRAPLILLHGNGEDHTYFEHQIKYFSARYRVLAVDTRGHGKSPRGELPFTISQFAEDLNDFMDELCIDKSHILGFSDGANIAMTFALKYPDRVEHLILNGGNLDAGGVKRSVQLPIEIGYKITSLFANKSTNALRHMELLGLMVNEPNIEPEQLKTIKAPTLVIAGENDMIKNAHTRLIYESLSNAELAIIRGNHFIANKNPEEFNRTVDSFLSK